MTKTAVVALGGNALTLPGQAGRCEEMLARAAEMAGAICEVMDAGWRVVVVHGNGPQVIDKDRAARLLATLIGAQALLLVTAVDRVMLDYGTPGQTALGTMTAEEAARHLEEGQFPPGSMGPKIEAALRFLADGGDLAVVTTPGLLARTLAGNYPDGGTRIEPTASRAGPGR
jgi:carbamate kinase